MRRDHLSKMAAEARKHGMSYGKYVSLLWQDPHYFDEKPGKEKKEKGENVR